MARHDIFVYDDDTRQLHLRIRCGLAVDALRALADSLPEGDALRDQVQHTEVRGFSSREQLLTAIEARQPFEWVIALIDLQDSDGTMRGGRILQTIRDHPELRRRCMPAALTAYAHPGMHLELQHRGFALVNIASTDSPARLRDALAAMLARHPTAEDPQCEVFPDAEPLEQWQQRSREAFFRRFGFAPHMGDDLVIRHLALEIPDTVTNLRLKALRDAGHAHVRKSVDDFKRQLAETNGWALPTVIREVRAFVAETAQRDFADPVDPGELPTVLAVWRTSELRRRARFPTALAAALDDFFRRLERELAVSEGGRQSRVAAELALQAARTDTANRHHIAPERLDHAVLVLLDVVREHPDGLAA